MNNLRISAVLLILVIIGAGILALFASEAHNWTLLVLVGYGTMTAIAIVLMLGLRYLSRKVRTEGRNSRSELEFLRDATLALKKSVEDSAGYSEQTAERILTKLDLHDTAISQQRKQLKAAAVETIEAVSTLQKKLREQSEALNITDGKLEACEAHIAGIRSNLAGLKSDLSDRILVLEQKVVSFTDLKEAKNGLRTEIREAERKVVASTSTSSDIRRLRERLEAAESRILGSVESEAFQHGSTIHDQTQVLERLRSELESLAAGLAYQEGRDQNDIPQIQLSDSSQLKGIVSTLRKHITTTVRDGTRQVESLIQLAPYYTDKKMPMPSTGNFAIDAQALAHLITLVEDQRPKKILELGSGTSTIWLGYLCKSYGGKLITLDHLSDYLEATKVAISRHDLNDEVEARLAPLEDIECNGQVYSWYSKSSVEDLFDIDLLVIDGPPAATGKNARYPALPEIVARLSSHATVVLDDAHRDEELSIIDEWLEYFPEFRMLEPGTSRLAVLQRGSD